jgi:hypothetical protein
VFLIAKYHPVLPAAPEAAVEFRVVYCMLNSFLVVKSLILPIIFADTGDVSAQIALVEFNFVNTPEVALPFASSSP